jgi:putative MFS transporter
MPTSNSIESATMNTGSRPLARSALVLGCVLVTLGTAMHLPMFLQAKDMNYVLAGMPMDPEMIWGMAIEILGLGLAVYGLLPSKIDRSQATLSVVVDDTRITFRQWTLLLIMAIALVIDIMKPASLGFVIPGMKSEYHLAKPVLAWLPFSALMGTFVGSLLWGWLADIYGRRSSMLLASLMFIGTSICGAMPDFWWNVAMCWLMGLGAGGMLPVAYALLTEVMPAKHRGWVLVLVGALGSAGGYLAASWSAALLQPEFGWRIMWFLNLPTGLLLTLLIPFVPESPKFLAMLGRVTEAEAMLKRFSAHLAEGAARVVPATISGNRGLAMFALSLVALAWSLINFGVLLWLPGDLVAHGYSLGTVTWMLAKSAIVGVGVVAIASPLYSGWSTKGTVVLMCVFCVAGLAGLAFLDQFKGVVSPSVIVGVLLFGTNGLLATLLPYTAELFSTAVRGRATGWIAGCTKAGGLVVQGGVLMALVPPFGTVSVGVAGLMTVALASLAIFGAETRGNVDADSGSLVPSSAAAGTK